jgi:hypothetical protein
MSLDDELQRIYDSGIYLSITRRSDGFCSERQFGPRHRAVATVRNPGSLPEVPTIISPGLRLGTAVRIVSRRTGVGDGNPDRMSPRKLPFERCSLSIPGAAPCYHALAICGSGLYSGLKRANVVFPAGDHIVSWLRRAHLETTGDTDDRHQCEFPNWIGTGGGRSPGWLLSVVDDCEGEWLTFSISAFGRTSHRFSIL